MDGAVPLDCTEQLDLPLSTYFIRHLDTNITALLIVYKDWLWGADFKVIKQYNFKGQCIQSIEANHTLWVLFGYKDCLYSGSPNNTMRVWDIINGECIRQLQGH